MRGKIFTLLFSFFFVTLHSQSISLGITPSPVCSTGVAHTFKFNYTIAGIYAPGNVFSANLYDNLGNLLLTVPLCTAVVPCSPVTFSIPSTYTAGNYQFRITSSAPTASSNIRPLVISNPICTPFNSIAYGINIWNVYAYQGYAGYNNMIDDFVDGKYYQGSYTETNLSFTNTTRWAVNGTPSSANGVSGAAYCGCPVSADDHVVLYKRIGFPCGYYQLDVPYHDDAVNVSLNGSQILLHTLGCCDSHTNIATTLLTSTSTIDYKWTDIGSGSVGQFSLNLLGPTVIAPTGINVGLGQFVANWLPFFASTSYSIDLSTTPTFSTFVGVYNDFPVGNVTSYTFTGLPLATYYYRVRAQIPCGISGNSNTSKNVDLNFILPVELMYFNCYPQEDMTINFNWATAAEKNNDHFAIEGSSDGERFSEYERTKATNNSGGSNYNIAIKTNEKETYFRLRQTDFDKTSFYSNVIYCQGQREISKSFAYVGEDGYIHVANKAGFNAADLIIVYDALGRELFENEITERTTNVVLNQLGGSMNFYVVRIVTNGRSNVCKIVSQ